MLLRDKYELGPVIREGEVRTISARELPQGNPVMVHELVTSAAQLDVMPRVVKVLQRAPAGVQTGILDMFEAEGRVYLVTCELPGFTSLPAWLASSSPAPAPAAEASCLASSPGAPSLPPARPAATPSGGGPPTPAGELTRLFQGLDRPPRAPAAADSMFGQPEPAANSPAPKPGSTESGSGFTQVFESPAGRPPGRMELSAPHFPLSGQSSKKEEPGEFTRVFGQDGGVLPGGKAEASFQIEKLSTSTGSGGGALSLGTQPGSAAGPDMHAARSDRAASGDEVSFTEWFGSRPSPTGTPVVKDAEPPEQAKTSSLNSAAIGSAPRSVANQPAAVPRPPTVPAPPAVPKVQTVADPAKKAQPVLPSPVQSPVAPGPVKIPPSLARPPIRPPAPPPPRPPVSPPQLKTPAFPSSDVPKPSALMTQMQSGIPLLPLALIIGGGVLLVAVLLVYLMK